jgi:isopentenyldiphosphate isomerase
MAEYFDLLSPTGEPLGITKERNAVHRDGDWHPSVHIFVIQGDRVLLQRRKWDKESFPGKLDLACTGHVVYIVFYLVLQLQLGAVCHGVFHVQLVHLVALYLYHTFTPLFYQPHMAQL